MIAARDIFRRARRAAPLIAVAALLALPSLARAGAPAPLLPDLVQVPPPLSSIKVAQDQNDHWVVEFSSVVGNIGDGPFEMDGTGPGYADMTAYQVAWTSSDDSTTPYTFPDPIGTVHYEDVEVNHNHWHFTPLDEYQLRTLDGSKVASDRKEGFCLVNSVLVPGFAGVPGDGNQFTIGSTTEGTYFCRQGHPEATEIREGISVGWGDVYTGFNGGTDIDLTGVPAGRYYLVQKVNDTRKVHELNYDNNAWSATVDVAWPSGPDGAPIVKVLNSCPNSETCPYTDPPPPPPPPPAAPDTTAPKLLLGGATRQRFLRGRAIYVYAKCDEVCTIKASGRIAALQVASSLRTTSAKLTLRPGVRTKVKLPISARTRKIINRQLKRGARVVVRVSLIATDSAGNPTATLHRTLTLLRRG
ncbi:MAG TPA: lysyl oxidase family protein [Thermoleophilaceae bacterium]